MYLTHTVSTYLAGKAAFKDKYILDFTDDDFLTHSPGFIKKKKQQQSRFYFQFSLQSRARHSTENTQDGLFGDSTGSKPSICSIGGNISIIFNYLVSLTTTTTTSCQS